jgi:hypothetical protein
MMFSSHWLALSREPPAERHRKARAIGLADARPVSRSALQERENAMELVQWVCFMDWAA